MDDLKKINRRFLTNLFLFIGIIIVAVVVGILSFFFIPQDIAYLIWFILLVVLMIISGIFRGRLDELTNFSYIIRIRANAGPPLHTAKNLKDLERVLQNNGYEMKGNSKNYVLFYRVTKDDIKRIFKRFMLEVVVLSKTNAFFIEDVDKDIDSLHAELHKQKKKTDKLFVTQIREISDLTDEVKEQIKEIAFVRSQRGVVSIINVGIHTLSRKAVMMYTDTYRPSLYYEFHVNQIKKIL